MLNLVPRSPVKVNDVTVGEVIEVERDGWHAADHAAHPGRRRPARQRDRRHPADQPARARSTSPSSRPPARSRSGELSDGDDIPLSATGRNPELEEVLGALSFLLNGGGVGQLKTITTELNKVFDGRQDRVRHVLGELEHAGRRAGRAEGRHHLGAMESMNGLAATLNQEKETVDRGDRRVRPGRDGAGRPARPADGDARAARPARRGRHPGHQRDARTTCCRPAPPPAGAARDRRGRRDDPRRRCRCSSASRSRSSPTTSSTATTPTPRSLFSIDLDNLFKTCPSGARPRRARACRLPDLPDGPGAARRRRSPRLPASRAARTPRPARQPHVGTARSTAGGELPGGGARHDQRVKVRLIAFVMLSAVGIVYVSANYLGLVDRVLGRGYTCTPSCRGAAALRGQRGHLSRRADRQGRRR